MTAGVLVEHDHAAAAEADVAGVDDLVRLAQLGDPVLVDAGLVAEGVGAHDRLVGLHPHAGKLSDQTAGAVDLSGVHVRREVEEVAPRLDRHHHLLQGCVARPLADAVDAGLDLAGAGADSGQAVGHGQPEVVVTVDGDQRLVDVGHVLLDLAKELAELLRDGVAYGIGDVDGGRPGLNALADHAKDVLRLGAGGVHRGELHVGAVLLGSGHLGAGHLQHLLAVLLQLVKDVDIGDGEEYVDARLGRVLHGLPAGVHVAGDGAGQAGDDGAAHLLGDGDDGLEVARRGRGEAGLDEVHLHTLQGARDLQLLAAAQGDAGRLLAVPQRRVKNQYPLAGGRGLVFACHLLNLH